MNEIRAKQLEEMAVSLQVPGHVVYGLVHYIMTGRGVGGFLEAVLTNDLFGALRRADDTSLKRLHNIAMFLHSYAPMRCYGSPQKHKRWMQIGGLEGLERREEDAVDEAAQ